MKWFFLVMLLLLTTVACYPADETSDEVAFVSEHSFNFTVHDGDGSRLGIVESTIIAPESGAIQYAVVQVPRKGFPYGKASMVVSSESLIPVPWELLMVELTEEKLVLSADGMKLQEAPRYDELPSKFENHWDTQIRNYWKVNSE